MTEREKVIKGLRCCRDIHIGATLEDSCNICPYQVDYGRTCYADELFHDAIALLKAQEPRVMTLQEALGAEVNVDQCWLEVKGIKQIYLADAVVCPEHTERADIQRWGASDCQLPLDLYGAYWRMWTAKPTDEQREAASWR